MELEFEWDTEKDKINQERHNISFDTAKEVFYDSNRVRRPDFTHSFNEPRYITIGLLRGSFTMLFISYTKRSGVIRIISARKATKKERSEYYDRFMQD